MCCSLTMQQWLSKATPVYCLAQGLYFMVELHFWYSTTARSVPPRRQCRWSRQRGGGEPVPPEAPAEPREGCRR